MQLVDDEEPHLLDGLPRLPAAAHQVPLLGGRDHEVGVLERLDVDRVLANKLRDLEAEHLTELVAPLDETLLRRRRLRRDIHAALDGIVAGEHPQDRKLGANDLAAGRRRADQAVVVGGVQSAERLRLDGIENLQALRGVNLLSVRISQGGERQGLEIEELRVRRILLRQDEVAERHRQEGLRVDPAVGHHADEVLRRQRLRNRHSEVPSVLLLGPALLQHEHFLVQDLLTVDILDENPERLGSPMDARIPLEIGGDRQLHHEAGARDGLHVCAQIQLGKLVDQLVDGLAHLGEPDQFADLRTGQIVVTLPSEVFLLHLSENVFGEALEMAERRLRAPHALVDHLAPIQSAQGEGRPTSAKADLEDGPHDAARGLLHVDHVRQQREAVELELGNVGLQQDVDFGRRLVRASLHRHGHALDELGHLHLFLLTHRDVLELVGQREQTEQLDVRHHGAQMVVERCDRRVPDVVMAGHATQCSDLHLTRALVVLDQIVLVEQHERAVHQVDAPLLQKPVLLGLIGRDAVQPRRAHHAHVQVRVAEPVHRILACLDGAQHELGVDQIRQSTKQLGLHRQLLVVEGQVVLELAVLREDDAMP
mmetsp:Transcript_113777/g.326945  ORF Transcript_113777/g.326945 Transcript_113777/m.326945 type:complete len:596 (+) Transcript_113777:2084-3871(+)